MSRKQIDMYKIHDQLEKIIRDIEAEQNRLSDAQIDAGLDGDKEKHDLYAVQEAIYEQVTNPLWEALYMIEEKFYG